MVIAGISNGVGNQLFQYAMGRRLAVKRGVPLKLDLSWFEVPQDVPGLNIFSRDYRLGAFEIQAETATFTELKRYAVGPRTRSMPDRVRGRWLRLKRRFPLLCGGMRISERDSNFEAALLHLPGNVHLHGWWQSENYFRDISDLLRKELTFRDHGLLARATAFVRQHRSGNRPLISVQVRRGDVARAHEVLQDLTHMPYELVSREYLQAAIASFGDQVTFLVFSETPDDIVWCQDNLRAPQIRFASSGDELQDFSAMSQCDHHIISNSSFGWWAAWLNPDPKKTVIAPRRWFRREYAPQYDIHSLVPPAWKIL